jgi:spore cortex formation protein SpoVR/YcgB (stage V sporulation)
MSRYGRETVTEFMDHLFRIETLVDPINIWKERKAKDVVITDNKDYVFPRRIKTKNDYMEDWINTKSFIKAQNKKIEEREIMQDLNLLITPESDIFGYIKENAPFKPWQRDIAEILSTKQFILAHKARQKH